jgi:hypothetical protein
MERDRLNALINLLDDPDSVVYQTVEQELLKEDDQIIPALEQKWEQSFDENNQERIENLIQNLQFKKTYSLLKDWVNLSEKKQNLFDGFCAVDRILYPDLNPVTIGLKIEKLRKSVWLELKSSLTFLEKITILNHFIFNLNGYTVNHTNPHSPQNCFFNQLLDTKKGNAVSMSIFYTIVARAIELPAKLVDFPRNPLVAITDANIAHKVHGDDCETDVIFYVNPANKGAITSRKEVHYHLSKNDFEPFSDYADPKPDCLFIQRLLESMIEAYESVGFFDKKAKIEKLLTLF